MSPASHNIFKNETAQFTARAYKADGSEVSTTMVWSVEDPAIASVSQSGVVTGLAVGETKVRVEAQGIVSEAAVYVAPTKTLVITPYYTTIAPSDTRQFTAQLYNVSRNSNGDFVLTAGVTPSNLHWEIPTYGFSMFDFATVNQQGLVTMKSDAMPAMMTVLLVSDPNSTDTEAGAASIGVAMSSGCNCGTRDAAAASIRLNSASSVTLSMGQTHQIQADVLDANGNVLSSASLNYCSSDIQVADVDATGEISATAFLPNTATVTVCHGNLSRTITVNVQ
jgi:plastocyanin